MADISSLRNIFFSILFAVCTCCVHAQEPERGQGVSRLADGLGYKVEVQTSFSSKKTPLWLNANKYGLSSLDKSNGYIRAAVERPLAQDSARKWGVGYAVDLAAAYNYTSSVIVQQAYAEARWLHGVLSVGSKCYPMELKNNSLSSGSQTLGINARPVPQVRIAMPEYWKVFGLKWLRFKGHLAYGWMTDEGWQHDFTHKKSKYTDHGLYHSKSGYLMLGNPEKHGFTAELGLEMACVFGGNSYLPNGDGTMRKVKNGSSFLDYWHVFIPGGFDSDEDVYKNRVGDQLGSWVARFNYDFPSWRISLYADKFFDDHSAMFQLDYDGYGNGDEWDKRKKNRYFLYDMKDIMLGAELNLKKGTWLRNVVLEYVYTKYQSGPIYHDHSPNVSDHLGGVDNYYNNYIYTGWQHWGQAIGNPLYTSPLYNSDGTINFNNNRFVAFHLGVDGRPTDAFSYRMLLTYEEGLGTYSRPYTDARHNVSAMIEGTYALPHGGWSMTGALGMDAGSLIGHNYGVQLTLAKTGLFNRKQK